MGGKSLRFNLKMLNLWIGLCRGVAGLPNVMRNLGYEDKWIEYTFSNQDVGKVVCPDLIVASEQLRHTILLEFKSGANTKPDQLWRYSRVTSKNLETAFISREAAHSHDVSIVGRSKHGERLRIGIVDGGYEFPLLLANDDGLSLEHSEFRVSPLNSEFSSGLNIDWTKIPSIFAPIDEESDLWEVAEVIMPKILHYMTQRMPSVRIEDLCQDVCSLTWGIMGRPAKDGIRKKVQDVLREAMRQHFKSYLRWRSRGYTTIQIVANPLDLQPDKRTAAYRKLRTAQRDLIENLRTGQGPNGDGQLQLPLD